MDPETEAIPAAEPRDDAAETVPGADEAEPATPEADADQPTLPSPPPVRPAGRGTDRPLIPTRAREDADEGWGGSRGGLSRDDEIRNERPPHW